MPIDPRIILGIQAPQFKVADPLESAHKSLALQALMGQQELQGLQVDEARRSADANQRLAALFGRNPNATPEEVMAIDPAKGLKMRQDLLTNRKTQADIDKTTTEIEASRAKLGRDLIASANPSNYAQIVEEGRRLGQQWAMTAPAQFDPNWQRQHVITADKWLEVNMPKIEFKSDNKTMRALDVNPITNPNITQTAFTMQTTPGEDLTDKRTREEGALNRGVTIRGQNMTDARARETLAAGKAPAGYRFKDDGSLEAIPGGPADGKADKLGEAAKKQIAGIDSLGSAIDEYVAAVKGWDAKKMLSPDQRAAMGTKYNNMMLQAKEAFNLGVLNGPDYQILQSVIADPTQFKNALISSDAMAGQAEELKRLMERTRAAVKNQGRGEMPLSPTPAASASPSMPAVPKAGEVRKGYRFKGGDPSSPQSWEKV